MIFDSHLHIIDARFPLIPNQGYLPEEFTCADYLRETQDLQVAGGAIVSGSFQGYDQSYLLAALDALGPSFVGVVQAPALISDEKILELDAAGVRAVRFNVRRGVAVNVREMISIARRIHTLAGWHVELYVDAADLPDVLRTLLALPKVVIDHLGLTAAGLSSVYKLVERGMHVKASGFGRLDFDPAPVLREIASINPDALLFGTDLPSTRAQRPFQSSDLRMLEDVLEPALAGRALYGNAVALYRPRQLPSPSVDR